MYYTKHAIKAVAKRILRRPPYPRRYDGLYEIIRRERPKTILEIGTHDGMNARRMIRAAEPTGSGVRYYGFDLFETQTPEMHRAEFSLHGPSRARVERFLSQSGARATLHTGDSRTILPAVRASLPPMDLVFIDGGHSLETVRSDWTNITPLLHGDSVVLFDDYPQWGVGPVVDSLDAQDWTVEILPTEDRFAPAAGTGPEKDGTLGFRIAVARPRKAPGPPARSIPW